MKKVIAAVALSAAAAPVALAAGRGLNLSPNPVTAGKKVRVSGGARGCRSSIRVSSSAFSRSATAHPKHGRFSVKAATKTTASGSYTVIARCGSRKIGTASLNVTGFY